MEDLGSIILVKNIVFGDEGNRRVDHAWATGRPCVRITEINGACFVLPATSKFQIIKDNSFFIPKDQVEWIGFNEKDSFVSFDEIIKTKICGRKIFGVMDENLYYKMISRMLVYYNTIPYFNSNKNRFEIMDEIQEQAKYLESKILTKGKRNDQRTK